jgi:hypothetical protein
MTARGRVDMDLKSEKEAAERAESRIDQSFDSYVSITKNIIMTLEIELSDRDDRILELEDDLKRAKGEL